MITKYGYDVFFTITAVVIIGCLLSWYLIELKPLRFGLIGILLAFFLFTLNFFRDPDRTTPQGEDLIISPADGKVVVVKEVFEDEFLKSEAIQISIFMSPLNVHVNRYPINGKVAYFKHIPGEYLVAYEEKSSLRNERTHIGVENGGLKVFFKQIAGFVARRIVAPIQVGDEAIAGERFGMIKFGSRVDVFVPKSSEIKVKVGDTTAAGETVIAVVS
ncbi:MAG: phosphatidylserine decarboxylase family protein [Bacteroidetes bacterium]|nr:phosphatidylserine decarboxylase family protein [Bacteroidota bacterium]MCW5895321.1 phosphatidylserine decarboxylase family protein [Bacteroidota bacterium]